MKVKGRSSISAVSAGLILVAMSSHVLSQPGSRIPDRAPAADRIVERQVERQLERARQEAERVQQQAERQADRALQQAERVQQQAERQTDRAMQQAERVQQQAERVQREAERAQQQVERVQQQADRAQQQVERVQQQADRAQRQAERAQQQADRAQQQVERVQLQAERAQQQAERLQQQVERVGRLVPAVADRAREQSQGQAKRVQAQAQSQALGKAQNKEREKVQARALAREPERAANGQGQGLSAVVGGAIGLQRAQDPGTDPDSQAGVGQDRNNPSAGTPQSDNSRPDSPISAAIQNPGQAPSPQPAPLPDRLAVAEENGQPAFVEIQIEPYIRVLEREWLMMVTAPQRDELEQIAPQLMAYHVETRPFEALDSLLLKFRVPPGLDSEELLGDLMPETMRGLLDRNHVYSVQSDPELGEPSQGESLTVPMASVCAQSVSIGMIDTGIERAHAAFHHNDVMHLITRHFVEEQLDIPVSHGTAVAGLLVGQGPQLNPLLPNATVYSASVMYAQDDSHASATAMHLLEALDWLIAQDVGVINMSLAGPANRLLEQGIRAATARGKVVVAAAGNAGPHAPALYPAAYEDVIAATAVARDKSIYRWANQGEHIDFSALGVGMMTAGTDGEYVAESGTSMAAPVVSAFMACALAGGDSAEQALTRLRSIATDLGEPGRDRVYGHGLLHPQAL